ncbi:ABC transporter ATP-binding protein [Allosediminivita pacifica]|uniref:NitT/TauT family transport system ATP-binding protein n=1 Tax=Allosediminivita pacifica TaxID=1267769 RepID=A0A2T6AQL6_9RHOB|nr:ABC transporter ATP-binding protein [Allosediminivita pacifica]PTX46124.1 NitT/TauT family transport system ATP-binding protein [Allosediminivita pacifica]GGB18101.1 spermidine/putrescine ABC transporter ATP-binding protein [Allosediminivita pacifica]
MSLTQETVLEADEARVVYNEDSDTPVEAVRSISLDLRRGEVLALVGPSGCGKTTLFNAIAGLIPLQGGRVSVGGIEVEKASGHVGYMLQKDLLLPWRSVIDNVTLGLEVRGKPKGEARKIAQELIERYGLAGFENSKPSGLSGGMRQRVALMRTLAFEPEVILLDEPFSALDFQTRILLQSDVKRIIREEGKSVILITHDIGEAISMANRIVVLTNRPATVKTVHEVPWGDEVTDPVAVRDRPEYQEMFSKIWQELELAPRH